ncbi:hypothetical protein BpHYR1_027445 [Brachionus plicatilis]|uniref:Uncharacterized protein n=1 Tax=Brachionus plicatilis TaxID=10195 RepID=A0A3M7SRK5_BRAPC|nr:hypothetical protein BpHYR1_027445 [Brachionus plicatilis]
MCLVFFLVIFAIVCLEENLLVVVFMPQLFFASWHLIGSKRLKQRKPSPKNIYYTESNEKPNEPKHVRVERKEKGKFVGSISEEVEKENDNMNENIFKNVFNNEYQEIPFIQQFKKHVPKWEAKIVYNGIALKNFNKHNLYNAQNFLKPFIPNKLFLKNRIFLQHSNNNKNKIICSNE